MAFDMSLATRILERALKRGTEKARTYCKSKTLKKFMYHRIEVERETNASGVVRVPHYWAKFYHDGRDAVVGKLMVWFKDPNEDPRIKNGYPIYRANVKSLADLISPAKFRELRKSGAIYVKRAVGPSKKKPQNPFFSNTGGMSGLGSEVAQIGKEETYKYVEEQLRSRNLKNRTVTRYL